MKRWGVKRRFSGSGGGSKGSEKKVFRKGRRE